MLEKCAACGGRILAGGERFADVRFCNDHCLSRFKAALVDESVPADVVTQRVAAVFQSPCPQCGNTQGNDLYSATKMTGMLLAYQIESGAVLCCATCGRKNRLTAALHCLLLGWWSPRALFFNLFVLPSNLIACLFIRKPRKPSSTLTTLVKAQIADEMFEELAASQEAEAGPSWELKQLGKRLATLERLTASPGSDELARQLFDATGKTPTDYVNETLVLLEQFVQRAKNEDERKLATAWLETARSFAGQIRDD